MSSNIDFGEMLTLVDEYTTLVPVSEIPNKTTEFYYAKANALNKYCKPELLQDSAVDAFPLFRQWCNYIKRFPSCEIAPHPREFVVAAVENISIILTNDNVQDNNTGPATPTNISVNTTSCYDDFYCEPPDQARLNFLVYGAVFALICVAGLILNVACLVAFNKPSNRTGATLYFSVIALMDCIYMGIKLTTRTTFHLVDTNYSGQERAYAQRVASLIAYTVPLLTFSELASVWLILCVLVDRYLYLQRGYFSKSVTSLSRQMRLASLVVFFSICYTIPRFFEFKAIGNPKIPGGYRAVLTEVGKSTLYRNLTDYLLNIPIEMFIPYMAITIVTGVAVSKMVDFGSSKWKAVASICSTSGYCCCGDDFADCYPSRRRSPASTRKKSPATASKVSVKQFTPSSTDIIEGLPNSFTTLPRTGAFDDITDTQVYYCGIPFAKRSDLMPFYFLVPPPRQKLQETANVVIAVCLGFLLLLTKVPKLVLIALDLEKYAELDVTLLRMGQEILALSFIILKPPIYLILGVHFRHALTGLFCCACLYSPVIRGNPSSQEEVDADFNPVVGDGSKHSTDVHVMPHPADAGGGGRVKRRGNSLPSTGNPTSRGLVDAQPSNNAASFVQRGSFRRP